MRGSIPFIGKILYNLTYYLLIKFFYLKKATNLYLKDLKVVNQLTIPLKKIDKSLAISGSKFLSFNSDYIYLLLTIKTSSKVSNIRLFWFGTYLSFFLKKYTTVNINWQFLNIKLIDNKKLFVKLWKKTYHKNTLKNFFCSSWFYLYILLSFYCFKDIKQLVNFFVKVIQRYPLKYHKRLFRLVSLLFVDYLSILQNDNKLKGFRLYFKGKLGKKGSVKKSTIYVSGGQISYTNKMLKYNYKRFLIPTETGVVGCYLGVFFKKNVYIHIYIFNTLRNHILFFT